MCIMSEQQAEDESHFFQVYQIKPCVSKIGKSTWANSFLAYLLVGEDRLFLWSAKTSGSPSASRPRYLKVVQHTYSGWLTNFANHSSLKVLITVSLSSVIVLTTLRAR